MNADKNRLLYYIGTSLIVLAVIELTIFPYITTYVLPLLYIEPHHFKNNVSYIFIAALVCYLYSEGYYKKELLSIFYTFIYYLLFQIIVYNF